MSNKVLCSKTELIIKDEKEKQISHIFILTDYSHPATTRDSSQKVQQGDNTEVGATYTQGNVC